VNSDSPAIFLLDGSAKKYILRRFATLAVADFL
jgi:hypothetical protein